MNLATTLGLFLLLTHPQTPGMRAVTFIFQTQENPPSQNPPEPAPPTEETKPQSSQPEPNAEQPALSPNSADNPVNPPATSEAKPAAKKTKPAPPKKTPLKKSVKNRAPRKNNNKVVVKNGGISDSQAQISSGTNDQQASQKLRDTNFLLGETTDNLQKISSKQLNPTQQDMVKQIRNYIRQSKDAVDAGDLQGANNLAVKAHLLSQELIKP